MDKTGIIFGQIKARAEGTAMCENTGATYEYEFSSGATMVSKKLLEVGTWHFFKVRVNCFGGHSSISHCELGAEASELDAAYADLKVSSTQVQQFWNKLEAADRQIIMRTVGVGMGAATTAGLSWSAISSFLAEEALLGAATGGITLVAAGVMAGFTYLQYEERKEALANRVRTFEAFLTAQKRLSNLLVQYMPAQYRNLEPLDPHTKSIVSKTSYFIKNFDWSDIYNPWASKGFTFSLA